MASFNGFSQISRDYKKQVKLKYGNSEKQQVLELKSTNKFSKEMLNAQLKPKTFTPSSLLLESKPEIVSYSGENYTLTPLKMRDKGGAFLLFNGLYDGLTGVVKIHPFDSFDDRSSAQQQLNLFMPIRKDKTYRVRLNFEVDFYDSKCRNPRISISNGNYAVDQPLKKGFNSIDFFTKANYTGNTLVNLLNYTLVSCNDQTFNKDRNGEKLKFLFNSVEVKELKE